MSGGDEKFSFRDIIPEKSFIGKFGQIFWLFSEDKFSYKGLIWLMVVSLVALSSVTYLEDRFAYGSVTIDVSGIGTVLGMSFMGDTMVWPNIFLIPLCLVLTLKAAKQTVSLLNQLCGKVKGSLSGAQKPPNFETTIKEVKEIFKGNFGRTARLNIALPWFLAALFWSYNTLTCGFGHYEIIPNPYTARDVVVITQDDVGRDIKTKTPLAQDMELPKWDTGWKDTGWKGAEMSIWLTRVWTLIFYTILPFIMIKLVWMVWGLTLFIKRFRLWVGNKGSLENQRKESGSLLVNPFHEDGFGGLSAIAETGMRFFYAAIGFVLLISMSFFKEGPGPFLAQLRICCASDTRSIRGFFRTHYSGQGNNEKCQAQLLEIYW